MMVFKADKERISGQERFTEDFNQMLKIVILHMLIIIILTTKSIKLPMERSKSPYIKARPTFTAGGIKDNAIAAPTSADLTLPVIQNPTAIPAQMAIMISR